MAIKKIEVEDLLKRIEHPLVKDFCARYILSPTQDQSLIDLELLVERFKRINTGKSNLWADYLESLSSSREQQSVRHKFLELAMLWHIETGTSSRTKVEHPAYQQIISLGEPVVPFLLEGLAKGTGRWFYALREISGEDPVLLLHRGWTEKMIEAWLEWGCQNGYQLEYTKRLFE